jgi:antitoxin CcdA
MNADLPKRRRLTDAARAAAAEDPEVREARRRKWVEENWESIQGWNEWVEKNGLPLAKYRQF